jgi:hypothetical protein
MTSTNGPRATYSQAETAGQTNHNMHGNNSRKAYDVTTDTDRSMSQRSRTRPARRLALFAAIALGLVVLLGACSSDTQDQIRDAASTATLPEGTAPPETAPPETAPPETAPPAESTPPEDGEGLTTEEWILIGILAVVVFALIIAGTSASARHSANKQTARAGLNSRLGEIAGGSRWMVDQGSVEILRTTDPAQLRTSWNDLRRRAIDLEGQIATLVSSTGDGNLDESLRYLGQRVAGLRGSLDSLVSLRTAQDATSQQALIATTEQTVYERRQQVAAAIEPVSAARR